MEETLLGYLRFFNVAEFGPMALWLWIFACASFLLTLYYLFIFIRISFQKNKPEAGTIAPVSVIIASRDDGHKLRKNLPQIMAQKEITFEVIVVDDCSYDDTTDVLLEYANKYANFRHSKLVENGDFEGGKKYAVTIGVKAAKYEHLVLIDADCKPDSTLWLKRMASHAMYKKVVLGYGPYEKQPGLLNMLIRYDTFKIAQQYLGFALAGVPYMGVGRNLAYHSYLYFESKGFTNHLNVVSGDDDLFVNEVSNSQNTGVELHPDSFVYSAPKTNYIAWEYQKRRHLTTGAKYKMLHLILLGVLSATQYAIVLSLLVLLINHYALAVVGGVFLFKLLLQGSVLGVNMHKMKVLDLYIWSVVLEPMLMLFYAKVAFLNIVKQDQRKRWV